MPKKPPRERWALDVIERVEAFMHSPELSRLREMGQAASGRNTLLRSDEWWGLDGAPTSNEYREFQREREAVGARFGLASYTTEWASLMEDFDPTRFQNYFALEAKAPQLRVVTDAEDGLFLRWLVYEAWQLGLVVILQRGPTSSTLIPVEPESPTTSLDSSRRPPRSKAFKVVFDPPSEYPPEAAAEMSKKAVRMERCLAGRLGYRVRQRMRSSSLTSRASELRVDKQTLDPGEMYDVIDDVYRDEEISEDRKRRNIVKSQRHRVKRRFQRRTE
jgi:hypothetical protein